MCTWLCSPQNQILCCIYISESRHIFTYLTTSHWMLKDSQKGCMEIKFLPCVIVSFTKWKNSQLPSLSFHSTLKNFQNSLLWSSWATGCCHDSVRLQQWDPMCSECEETQWTSADCNLLLITMRLDWDRLRTTLWLCKNYLLKLHGW